jgi:hypothetical protein
MEMGSLAICLPGKLYRLRNLAGKGRGGTHANASSSWTRAVREQYPFGRRVSEGGATDERPRRSVRSMAHPQL